MQKYDLKIEAAQLVCLGKIKTFCAWLAASLTSTMKHTRKLSAAKASSSILKSMYWKLKSLNISQTKAPGDTTSQDITASRINTMKRKITAGETNTTHILSSQPDEVDWRPNLGEPTVVVEGLLVRVALGDHHSQEDVLESREVEDAGVLHVGQVLVPEGRVIERNVPAH